MIKLRLFFAILISSSLAIGSQLDQAVIGSQLDQAVIGSQLDQAVRLIKLLISW